METDGEKGGVVMIILGVDPGFSITGFSLIEYRAGKTILLDLGLLRLPQKKHLAHRVHLFYDFFEKKITECGVSTVVLETPFLGKNAQNFLKLGYLRGILYLLSDQHNLALLEFAPREKKSAVTGFGGASKEQVARIVIQLFPGLSVTQKFDATDALAIGLCGLLKGQKSY